MKANGDAYSSKRQGSLNSVGNIKYSTLIICLLEFHQNVIAVLRWKILSFTMYKNISIFILIVSLLITSHFLKRTNFPQILRLLSHFAFLIKWSVYFCSLRLWNTLTSVQNTLIEIINFYPFLSTIFLIL